jgi:hypothetical protein
VAGLHPFVVIAGGLNARARELANERPAAEAPEPRCSSCRDRGYHVADRLIDGRWQTVEVACLACTGPEAA